MATKKAFVKLQCTVCKKTNYFAKKSKTLVDKKLELKKFCKWCKKHNTHKEVKR